MRTLTLDKAYQPINESYLYFVFSIPHGKFLAKNTRTKWTSNFKAARSFSSYDDIQQMLDRTKVIDPDIKNQLMVFQVRLSMVDSRRIKHIPKEERKKKKAEVSRILKEMKNNG